MMTFQVKTAVPPAKVLISSEEGSSCSLRGPDVPQYPAAFRELRTMGASGGQAAVRHNIQLKRFPVIQSFNKPRDEKSLFTTFIVGGSPHLAKDDLPLANNREEMNLSGRHFLFDQMCVIPERTRSMIPPLPRDYNVHRSGNLHHFSLSKGLPHSHKTAPFILESPLLAKDDLLQANNTETEMNIGGRHFLFDKNCVIPERTRTMIPPLPREYNVHRPGNLHHFSLSKGLSRSLRTGPFILDCPEQSELTTSPAICVPSSFVINGRNTFPVGNYKLSRPKMNNPTSHRHTVKENQKDQTYPDPVLRAPRPFLNRISELSSLQCETVRQERLKKVKKPKPSS